MDWKHLGAALAAAREAAQPRLTQQAAGDAIGVGRTTIQKIERGQSYAKVQPVHRAYAELLGWTGSSVDRVLAGGDPALRADTDGDADRRAAAVIADGVAPGDLSVRVLQALIEGPLLDSDVITITSPSGREVRAALVVRGEPGLSREEEIRDLQAWRERAQALEHVTDQDDGSS